MKKVLLVFIAIGLLFSITSCNGAIKDPNKIIDKILGLQKNYTLEKAENEDDNKTVSQ